MAGYPAALSTKLTILEEHGSQNPKILGLQWDCSTACAIASLGKTLIDSSQPNLRTQEGMSAKALQGSTESRTQ